MNSSQAIPFSMLCLISAAAATAQTNVFPLSGNVGIGTVNPSSKLVIEADLSNPPDGSSVKLRQFYTITASDVDYIMGFDIEKYWYNIPDGVTENGYQIGLASQVFVSDTNFRGTIAQQYGIWSRTGVNVAGSSGARTINNAYGIYLEGLTGAGTVVNHYGVFQTGANTKNYFGGNVGIGTTSPSEKLHIVGSIRLGDGGSRGHSLHQNYMSLGETESAATTILGNNIKVVDGVNNRVQVNASSADGSNWFAINFYNGFTFNHAAAASVGSQFDENSGELMRISTNGNVGVGTTAPQARLHVSSAGDGAQAIFNAPWTANDQQLLFKTGWSSNDATSGFAALGWKDTTGAGGAFWISTLERGSVATTAPTKRLYIDDLGNIGIGTTTPSATHKLSVNGSVRAKEVVVDTGWADYVFADDYRLAPLREVERHIQEKKHLPGIPSAREVAEQGVSIGDMQAKLLAKIEELTLHVIALEKRTRALEGENERLRTQ